MVKLEITLTYMWISLTDIALAQSTFAFALLLRLTSYR